MSVIIHQEDIAIFWDYDSTKSNILSTEVPTSEIVQNIRTSVFPFGTIKSFRAYGNFSGQALPRATNVRSDLFASGVTLMDCPNDGRKELGVKIMLVDMIAHAWNHPAPHTFVVITADRDVAYGISTLRMRKYRVLVTSPIGTHSDLRAQASSHLNWNDAVMGNRDQTSEPGDIFADIQAPLRPSSSSYPQSQPPPTSTNTSFAQTARQPNGFPHKASESQRPSNLESFELHDLPARGRRNSVFSSSFDHRKFDGFGDAFMTPKSHRGSFELGDGPLFPRPQSRTETQSRADSAPPNISYAANPMKPSHTRVPEKGTLPGLTTSSAWKGKAREFPILEPEYIAPQAPLDSKYDIPYSRAIFESFGNIQPPFGATFTVLPSANTGQPSRNPFPSSSSSNTSSSNSSRGNSLPPVNHPETSTAPTSAFTSVGNDDKVTPSTQPTNAEDAERDLLHKAFDSSLPDRKKSTDDLTPQVVIPAVSNATPTPLNQETKEKQIQTTSPSPSVIQPLTAASTSKPFSGPSPANQPPKDQQPSTTVASVSPASIPVAVESSTSRKVAPSQFVILVRTLQVHRSKGVLAPTRSQVSLQIAQHGDGSTYKKAGVLKFGQYAALAEKEGIIQLGGRDGNAWISLKPEWYDAIFT